MRFKKRDIHKLNKIQNQFKCSKNLEHKYAQLIWFFFRARHIANGVLKNQLTM